MSFRIGLVRLGPWLDGNHSIHLQASELLITVRLKGKQVPRRSENVMRYVHSISTDELQHDRASCQPAQSRSLYGFHIDP